MGNKLFESESLFPMDDFTGVVKWTAEKQPIITLSSMEVEYVTANTTARSAKWLTQFIEGTWIQTR